MIFTAAWKLDILIVITGSQNRFRSYQIMAVTTAIRITEQSSTYLNASIPSA